MSERVRILLGEKAKNHKKDLTEQQRSCYIMTVALMRTAGSTKAS